jgi:CheY-like chemotaxis protein
MTNREILKRRILIIDDEQSVRDTLSRALSFDGHSVVTAASGPEALTLFEPGKFHLVITDFTMPGMTGEQVAAEIKSRAPSQPVVAVTGHIENLHRTPVRGLDGYIGKPFSLADLREMIERYSAVV